MAEAKSTVTLTFHIYRGDELVRTERLTQDIIKVGKLASSHLRIDDDNVSRMHAVIEVTGPDAIYIIDLGSSSGTIVNGRKVNKGKLQNGDEILLGETRIVVEVASEAASEAEPTAVASTPPVATATTGALAGGGALAASASPLVASPAAKPVVPDPFSAPALPDPFAPPPPVGPSALGHHAAAEENGENVEYGIVASGPPVPAEEVETAAQAVEVSILWGERSVLHVDHVTPPRAYYVGDEVDAKGRPRGVDFVLAAEAVGTSRMPVVVESGGGVAAVIPQGASGLVTFGEHTMSIADALASGRAQPCAELAGASQIPLGHGVTVRVEHRGFTFVTRAVPAGKRLAAAAKVDRQPLFYVGGSMAVFGLFLLMLYFIPPRGGALSLDLLNMDSRLVKYLMEPPETREEETPEFLQNQQNDDEGGKGKRHKGEEGQMGKKEAKKTNNRYAIEGPEDNPDPHMAREEAREQARNAGILGVLRQATGAWNSPTSPFGRDTALGTDPQSALGALMGDQIGENFGFGGLGLRGTGRGGGGTGEGTIGLGNFGTIGHGAGGGSGSGYGRGAGGFSGRTARVPRIRQGTADVRGSLSKEVIRRVIHRRINEIRFCYEQELAQRPDLAGRVVVAFIISPTGAVQQASIASSDIGSSRVDNCVADAIRRLTFPAPEGGGIVIVQSYPFVFEQTGGGGEE
ncbi:MAG: TonB family protein [Myxococcota bacterium]|nr:TonB family protein [Myxococcota bacterium]MDW8360887.1 TonB family protein [Myxococcales bacterium]